MIFKVFQNFLRETIYLELKKTTTLLRKNFLEKVLFYIEKDF